MNLHYFFVNSFTCIFLQVIIKCRHYFTQCVTIFLSDFTKLSHFVNSDNSGNSEKHRMHLGGITCKTGRSTCIFIVFFNIIFVYVVNFLIPLGSRLGPAWVPLGSRLGPTHISDIYVKQVKSHVSHSMLSHVLMHEIISEFLVNTNFDPRWT